MKIQKPEYHGVKICKPHKLGHLEYSIEEINKILASVGKETFLDSELDETSERAVTNACIAKAFKSVFGDLHTWSAGITVDFSKLYNTDSKTLKELLDSISDDIDDLEDELTGKAESTHTHAKTDITGLAEDLSKKQDKFSNVSTSLGVTNIDSGGHLNFIVNRLTKNGVEILDTTTATSTFSKKTELEALSTRVWTTETSITGKADKSDTYTKTEIDDKLSGKATTSELLAVRNDVPTKTSELVNDSGYIGTESLSQYLKTSDASTTYATKTEVSGLASTSALSQYLKTSDASTTYATKTELTSLATASALSAIDARLKVVEAYIDIDQSLEGV